MTFSLSCNDDPRRGAVRDHRGWNGLDYIEVGEDPTQLTVYFLGKLPPEFRKDKPSLVKHVSIDGGRRVRGIQVVDVDPHRSAQPDEDDYLIVQLDRPGDFSTYTLRLVDVAHVDPHYDHVPFSFKVDCPSDLDCVDARPCVPEKRAAPELNYLAKDYATFRQLILDRLSVTMPDWRERHAADIGIALVEVLAYAGDYLSYAQDAVATEAYLDTARKRISVRRHARLVDYIMHEGCNARVWVCVSLAEDGDEVKTLDPSRAFFLTRPAGVSADHAAFLPLRELQSTAGDYDVFEPLVMHADNPIELRKAHNEIHFYTWGLRECCLPKGAISASLHDAWVSESPPPSTQSSIYPTHPSEDPPRALHLQAGDVLIFEEIIDPHTGQPADANRTHRHAVRLTKVTANTDPLFERDGSPTPVLDIEWAVEDALPFALCVSAIGRAPECAYLDPVSVARGNVILVDQGWTLEPEDLGCVPVQEERATCDCEGHPSDVERIPGRFEPTLKQQPLVFSQPLRTGAPASHALDQDVQQALPALRLISVDPLTQKRTRWQPRADLLSSGPADHHVVVEMDDERVAHLRFGDVDLSATPPADHDFHATYRIGAGGSAGQTNAGAEAICLISMRDGSLLTGIAAVRNPLPARGATEPQSLTEVKLLAPSMFRKSQLRAITADDYAAIAGRALQGKVQRAAAALNWTGSWYEADVVLDPLGDEATHRALMCAAEGALHPYRRIGHDVAVHVVSYVPLKIEIEVCVKDSYLRGHVKAALLDALGNRRRADGTLGFFHPDRLTFGTCIYLSQLVAAAQAVIGVESVTVKTLARMFDPTGDALRDGVLRMGPFEIAQLDNDPSFPERGTLTLTLFGGR